MLRVVKTAVKRAKARLKTTETNPKSLPSNSTALEIRKMPWQAQYSRSHTGLASCAELLDDKRAMGLNHIKIIGKIIYDLLMINILDNHMNHRTIRIGDVGMRTVISHRKTKSG